MDNPIFKALCSNLTNKYNPQELMWGHRSWAYGSNLTNKYNPQEPSVTAYTPVFRSNLTNKYNPQEPTLRHTQPRKVQILPINTILKNYRLPTSSEWFSSNLTNKYNPQERITAPLSVIVSSNLTNKYNPQELYLYPSYCNSVQILPINTILKNEIGD